MSYYAKVIEELKQASSSNSITQQIIAETQTKSCPICSGEMVNVSDLLRLDISDADQPLHLKRLKFGNSDNGRRIDLRVPATWECLTCWSFTTSPPEKKGPFQRWMRWQPEDIRPGNRPFAYYIFRFFPKVDEVIYYHSSGYTRYGWLFRIDSDWFYCPGTRAEVRKRLSLALK